MSQTRPNLGILVLGSMTWATALTPPPKSAEQASSVGEEFQRVNDWLGAPTIRRMICEALVDESSSLEAQREVIRSYKLEDLDRDREAMTRLIDECGEVVTALGYFPKKSSDGRSSAPVRRVKASYYAPSTVQSDPPPCLTTLLRQSIVGSVDDDIVIVYDRDPRFRKAMSALLRERSLMSHTRRPRALVIALAEDVDGEWISRLATAYDAASTIVIVTAEGLRERGLNIVEHGSIEQTVREVVRYTTKEPLKTILDGCRHLIILFEDTGAMYFRRDGTRTFTGSFHYCPNGDWVAQMEHGDYGRTPGRMFIAITAIVKQVAASEGESTGACWDLAPGVRLGIVAYSAQFSEGFDVNPFLTIETTLGLERRRHVESLARTREFYVSSLDFPMDETLGTWSRVNGVLQKADASTLLREIVKFGADKPFQQGDPAKTETLFPPSTIACPYFEVGKIKTVDHVEIERFIDLVKLIRRYLRDRSWGIPLSIAVFGPPGAGKGFAVKELLKTVNPRAKDQEVLTYNLAQFDSVALLTEAFHQVQDSALAALASDDAPLVIFDEFDSHFGAPLGWLKYFLAPMQDGLFRGQSIEYRVGRAIFVFAGGTFRSFKAFKEASIGQGVGLENAKLTDFISRLKGHLDVLDINPSPEEPEHERMLRTIRRAMILRSLLLQHAKPVIHPGAEAGADIAEVDNAVIDAFLNVRKYEHGVRSMESVVRMSRWIDGRYLPASMPSRVQLDMHAAGFWAGETGR